MDGLSAGVLECIRKEIRQNLLDTKTVPGANHRPSRMEGEITPSVVRGFPHPFDYIARCFDKIEGLAGERYLTGRNPRYVEERFDEVAQPIAGSDGLFEFLR